MVQLALNRPLRGIVVVPDETYGKTGIFPVSWEETQDGENCVVNGLILAITKRHAVDTRVRHRKTINGKKVTIKPEIIVGDYDSDEDATSGGREVSNVAKFTLDEMQAKVDYFFEQRYAVQEQEDGPPTRPAPYEHDDWRVVGVTALLVMDICNSEGIAVHVLHSDKLIQSFYPATWRTGAHHVCLCFNIWSDHAFFYDGSTREGHNIKVGVAKMRPVAPAKMPGSRLVEAADDDDRMNFADMREYDEEDFLNFVEMGVKAVLYTNDLSPVLELVETK